MKGAESAKSIEGGKSSHAEKYQDASTTVMFSKEKVEFLSGIIIVYSPGLIVGPGGGGSRARKGMFYLFCDKKTN